MLVLSRKPGESIYIGDDIEITVIKVDENKVRLGIKAPRTTQVHRNEVAEAIAREKIVQQSRPHI